MAFKLWIRQAGEASSPDRRVARSLLVFAVGVFVAGAATAQSAKVGKEPMPPGAEHSTDKPMRQGTWDGVLTPDQRARLSPLFKAYLCMSTDPPPECVQPAAQAEEDDLAARGGETQAEINAWAALKALWPNITGTPEQVSLIQTRAEQRGDPEALEMLGFLYQKGLGLPQNLVDAFKSYRHAYDLGRKSNGTALAEIWRSLNVGQKKELNT